MTDCEQQIYSNEYQDYLIEHTGDEALIKQWYGTDLCTIRQPEVCSDLSSGNS